MNKDLEKLSALYDGELPSKEMQDSLAEMHADCLLYTSPSPRDQRGSRMPSSA